MLQNPTNSSCADLIITNKPRSFQNSCTFEIGLFDFHKMTLMVLKSSFTKQKPRALNYRNYKFFNNTPFRDQVLNKLRNSDLLISDNGLKNYKERCPQAVITIAPLKCRFIRANQTHFINKEIQRGAMVKSKLRKKFLKGRSESDKKSIQ